MTDPSPLRWHAGGCHCGGVRFEALLPDVVEADDCNCSICAKTGFVHLIVPAARFRLLQGQELLTSYTFNTGAAKHLFCSKCGIKSFYVPRSNPDGFSVNLRCLDDPRDFAEVRVVSFDGSNWETHGASLAHKSQA